MLRRHSPARRLRVSGAAACFRVTVVRGGGVNRALALQRGLVFTRGRPFGPFTAVPDAITEVDDETWEGGREEMGMLQTSHMSVER